MTLIKHEFINILSFSAKKNTLSVINFFLRSLLKNKRNHRAYVQKKKNRDWQKKETIHGVTRFKVGCERGRWLPDWIWSWTLEVRWASVVCPTIQDRVWLCEKETWLIGDWRWRWWPAGEGCGWLAFEDEDGGRGMWLAGVWRWRCWERDVADCGPVNEDGLISLQMWNCELRERLRSKEKDGWSRSMDARVKKSNAIFFCIYSSTP